MQLLITSTSFQDTPGKHQELIKNQNFDIDNLRGPLTEDELLPIIDKYDYIICGDDEYNEKVLEKGKKGRLKVLNKYGIGLDKIDLNSKCLSKGQKNVIDLPTTSSSEYPNK